MHIKKCIPCKALQAGIIRAVGRATSLPDSFPTDADRGLLDRLNALNNTLITQWNRLQNIRNTVDNTSVQADRARDRVRDAENLIDRARQELAKAKDAVSKIVSKVNIVLLFTRSVKLRQLTQCYSQDIKPAGGTGEPNNMTLLAEEARRLADK